MFSSIFSENCEGGEGDFFFLSYFIQSRVFLSAAYLTVANLVRIGILVHCQVSGRSQYLVRLLSVQFWITGGHTIYPPIEGLLPPTGIEPTPFRNSASKVAELQVHARRMIDCRSCMYQQLLGFMSFTLYLKNRIAKIL